MYNDAYGLKTYYNTTAAGMRNKKRSEFPTMGGLLSWPEGAQESRLTGVQHLNRRRSPVHGRHHVRDTSR